MAYYSLPNHVLFLGATCERERDSHRSRYYENSGKSGSLLAFMFHKYLLCVCVLSRSISDVLNGNQ